MANGSSDVSRGTVRRHYSGCYRVTLSADRFGQIKKLGRQWLADVRDTASGQLVRCAGIWKTRRAATEELLQVSL